jgi:antitoxin component of RelBE/YafQ-DinJ toxin-antitoxin module
MDTQADTLALTFERTLAHPVEKVWRALTQGPLLEDWLMRNDFEPVVGRAFSFRAEPMPQWDGVVHCEVLECEPMSRLAYSWSSMGLLGLTVSDAVRILLTRTAREGALPFELIADPQAYDAWFRAKVREALDDMRPDVPHEEVEAEFAVRRAASIEASKA